MTNFSILSATLAAASCVASASAFVPASSHLSFSQLTAQSALEAMYNQDQEKTVSDRSIVGSSTLPGNLGFDPLNLAQTRRQLVTYRQAEIKHGRLAMLVSYY